MAAPMPGTFCQEQKTESSMLEPERLTPKWYFSQEEIALRTPSRHDGIGYKMESHLRKLYCSFLQELGIELKVPQVTIATAVMLCHRFYMHQSHAKNDWQTIATVCMFLACKAEETPRYLNELVVVAYKLLYKWDPSAPRRIREIYDKQKELILIGERLLLATVAFDLNIDHPYKPLVAAVKRLDITHKDVVKVAWNFVNDWLHTSLCLQHKPHYIAAGSLSLAAELKEVKLPTAEGNPWWMQFDVSPKQLKEVILQMKGLLKQNREQALPPKDRRISETVSTIEKAKSSSPESCILSSSAVEHDSKAVPSTDAVRTSDSSRSNCTKKQVDNFGNKCEMSESKPMIKKAMSSSPHSCSLVSSTVAAGPETVPLVNVNVIQRQESGNVNLISKEGCQKSESRSLISEEMSSSPQSCTLSGSFASHVSDVVPSTDAVRQTKSTLNCIKNHPIRNVQTTSEEAVICGTRDCGSAIRVIDDGDGEAIAVKSDTNSCRSVVSLGGGKSQLDINRIREKLKRRNDDRKAKKIGGNMDDDIDSEAWIELELENGIEFNPGYPAKRTRV